MNKSKKIISFCSGICMAGLIGVVSVSATTDKENPVGVTNESRNLPSWNCYKHIENPILLTEYPEKLLPYVGELERINAELNSDYEICRAFPNDEEEEYMIEFITLMSVEEFRDFVYEGYEEELEYSDWLNENTDVHYYSDILTEDSGTVGVIEYKGFNGVIKHGGGFRYFEGNNTGDNASDGDTSEPEDDILAGRIIMAESGGYWYLQDGSETDSWTGVLHNKESTDCSTGILYNEESTDEASDPGLGVYRGGAQLYPCD